MIIPAWNASETLCRCLDALKRQTMPPLETVVVDDGSSDTTAELARSYGVRVIPLSGKMGPALARNEGVFAASGEIALFVDADVVVPENLVERIAGLLSDPSVAGVQTLYAPDCPGEGLITTYQNFYYHHSLARMRPGGVAVFATWCAAVRRDVFLELGGFNTNVPEPTVEDEELGYAIADSGRVILLEKSLQVTHLAEYTFGTFAGRRLRMAVAQAKSGWRQVKQRLLARYMNVHETGTHHSRWVVLSILITFLAWLSPLSMLFTGPAGLLLFPALLFLALLCHWSFFASAVKRFGWRVFPGFAVMCITDMTILGFGIIRGTLEYLSGKHY